MSLSLRIGLAVLVGFVTVWIVVSIISNLLWYLVIGAIVFAALTYGYRRLMSSLPAGKRRERLERIKRSL